MAKHICIKETYPKSLCGVNVLNDPPGFNDKECEKCKEEYKRAKPSLYTPPVPNAPRCKATARRYRGGIYEKEAG